MVLAHVFRPWLVRRADWGLAALAALPARAVVPSFTVHLVSHELAPDAFDDAAWALAPPTASLTQQEPSEGASATLGAECRALATPSSLLVLFRLAQPPDEIVAHQLRRDADLRPTTR